MKKVMLFAMMIAMASPAWAVNTGTTFFHSHSIPDSAFTDTDTDTQRQDFGYGVGADVVVFKSDNPVFDSVEIQGRYDIELRETRVFGVVKVDLWDALKNR